MSGGGGQHRKPIEMPKDDGGGRGGFQIDRDTADLRPADGDGSAYRVGMRSAVVHHVVTAFLIAMVLGVGTWAYLAFKSAEQQPDGKSLRAPLFEVPAGNAQLERFRFALDVYFRIYEKYPPDIDALVDEGLLATSDLNHPRGSSTIVYERKGDSYELAIERTTITTVIEPAGADAATDAPDGGTGGTNGDAGAP